MKKMLFISIGNIILFALFGLAFAFPFQEIAQSNGLGFSGVTTIFPIMLLAYMVIYPIIYLVLKKLGKLENNSMSELSFSDEREKTLVSEAAKTAYMILIGGILVIMAILGGVKFFSVFANYDMNFYQLSVLLLSALLIVATITYCIKWCIAYRK